MNEHLPERLHVLTTSNGYGIWRIENNQELSNEFARLLIEYYEELRGSFYHIKTEDWENISKIITHNSISSNCLLVFKSTPVPVIGDAIGFICNIDNASTLLWINKLHDSPVLVNVLEENFC